jgi:Tfp pilus assembly protein PilV
MRPRTTHARRRQRGTTLLEALVAFLVLSLGMLTVARVQTQLRLSADVARQRSEAVRLAQEDLESLRAFAVLAASAGARSYEGIASRSRTVDSGTGYPTNTSYLVARQIDATASPQAKNASVTVSWTDRGGSAQHIGLSSIIAANDPAYSGALALARGAASMQGPHGRAVAVPLGAKDLGNGSSAFKPVSSGSVAFVFDNRSGLVTGRCTGVAAGLATRDLTAADLSGCDSNVGLLLSGVVRFSSASPPDPADSHDLPLATAVVLALSGGSYPNPPDCAVEAMKTVSYSVGGSLRLDAVPIGASAASLGLAGWADSGDRYLAYHCAVYPLASGQWSGHSTLQPSGWSIGTGAADRRVCRYTADLDGSGAIDANIEHPADYAGVDRTLANQNFLVIQGTETCPTRGAVRVAGSGADVYADLSTAPHQP